MISVLKANGLLEPFSENKVNNSLTASGIDKNIRKDIIKELKQYLYDGISTKEIYKIVAQLLDKKRPFLSSRYNLKQAIMALGPSGYPFENFFAKILNTSGFKTKVSYYVKGKCISHEIDILAQKENDLFAIEAKFHNKQGIKTDVKTALYVYARFLDIKLTKINIFKTNNINQMWLVTNTKLTSKAIKYCNCVGIKAIGWNYQKEWSLQSLVEKSGLYPITCLSSLSKQDREMLLGRGIVSCRDILNFTNLKTLIPKNKINQLKKEIEIVLEK